jgi:lipid-binding SYLF domain-containing protein
MKMSAIVIGLTRAAAMALVLSGFALSSAPAGAASKEELDAHARQAIQDLYRRSQVAKELSGKAVGILVFPSVVKAGFIFGGGYGEGALSIGGSTVAYYNIIAGSFGLQAGVQDLSLALMFMTPEALKNFRASDGWKVGIDTSVAIFTVGAGGGIYSQVVSKPIVGFVYNYKGVMANLALESSKISKIER